MANAKSHMARKPGPAAILFPPSIMALAARSSTLVSSRTVRSAAPRVAPRVSVVVRAEAEAAEKPKAAEKPVWTQPTLNPDTPSPIFGGSTGGLLRKAQVRRVAVGPCVLLMFVAAVARQRRRKQHDRN